MHSCLDAKGHKSVLKYVYEYMRCFENLQGIKTEEISYVIRFRMEWIAMFLIKINLVVLAEFNCFSSRSM